MHVIYIMSLNGSDRLYTYNKTQKNIAKIPQIRTGTVAQ